MELHLSAPVTVGYIENRPARGSNPPRRDGPGAPSVGEWGAQKRESTTVTTGLRIITMWNQCGGSGKSAITANLVNGTLRREIRTLLIGLGAPDIARFGMPPSQYPH